MVDTHALGACAAMREGSTPFSRTKIYTQNWWFTPYFPATLMYINVYIC